MIGRAYRTAQILSIDIAIGAVILLRFFCAYFDVSPGWEVYVLLGGTVWLIYTADHLRDAEKSVKSKRERYLFHRRNRKMLIAVVILALLFLLSLILFIPRVIFFGGFVLSILVFVYLLVQHRLSRFLSKEFYVAMVYSCGILMVPFLLSQSYRWDILILLILLTFVNLVLFSWYERDDDSNDGFHSIATELDSAQLDRVVLLLTTAGLSISLLFFSTVTLYFTVGFIIYAFMAIYPEWFRMKHRYRAIGDGVFLMPILFEWL